VKQRKVLLSLVLVVAVLFASVLPASAIEFEAEEKYNSVFVVFSGNALGSGFAVGSNCVVTNAHVIDDPESVSLLDYAGKEWVAKVVGMDEMLDIAVLAVADADFPVLEIADLQTMRTGDDAYAIGAPKSLDYTLTKGVISAKEREINGQTYIQTDAPINEGNSGGPLLSATGQVLGMNTLKMNDSEGIGLAIPVDRICQYMKSLEIPMDESGNVTGKLDASGAEGADTGTDTDTDRDYEDDDDDSDRKRSSGSGGLDLGWIVAMISASLNVVLLILLTRKNKKEEKAAPPPQDPRERTDFDIDILE